MKIAYISAPFIGDGTRESIKKNIEEARKYAVALASKKVGVFCPNIYDLDPNISDLTERQRYFYELHSEFLINSKALIAIPGWEESFGAKHEIQLAEVLGLPIFYPKSVSDEDLKELIDWYYQSEEPEHRTKNTNNINWDKVIDIRRAMSKYIFQKTA